MPLARATHAEVQRIAVQVRGQIQGVGFRPFVHQTATELGLSGWVRNDGAGVALEIEGAAPSLELFLARVRAESPPLARIDALHARAVAACMDRGFQIVPSEPSAVRTGIAPDTAICAECLAEMFDPRDRRYRYPFITCTHCGPRYTLTRALPYDRANTSMADFATCAACDTEYHSPRERRFHAQSNACAVCGPALAFHTANGTRLEDVDIVAHTVARLCAGDIVALKGLGGFHLACDARNAEAVARLRARKQRDEKPFALMALNVASLRRFVAIDADETDTHLNSRERPIVLLRKSPTCDDALRGVAPGIAWLGAMLPYTPLHYLLFHEAARRPSGVDWLEAPHELLLVMTSANPGDEPLVIDNDDALLRLRGIADGYVLHDRAIVARCDDSVVKIADGATAFLRRARGYTPQAINLARQGACVLALGAWLKSTVCMTRGDAAYLSPHIGDLNNRATCAALEETTRRMLRALDITPQLIAHDLHPDFFSTQLALRLARERDIPTLAVQHHHAHIAAVMAEHKLERPVIGLALDGVGLGTDGTAWGGELLEVSGATFERLGHLAPLHMPGGERAAREPWRMAASALHALGRGDEIAQRFAFDGASALHELLSRDVNCPSTTGMGRWFDAAAGLLGIKPVMRYEGQAAMLLESLATRHGPVELGSELFRIHTNDEFAVIPGANARSVLDLLPLFAHLNDCRDATYGAALFHATVVAALSEWVIRAAHAHELNDIALGGGCFLNGLLSRGLQTRLQSAGLRVWHARQVPPNDGGLSLGQAWIAMTHANSE